MRASTAAAMVLAVLALASGVRAPHAEAQTSTVEAAATNYVGDLTMFDAPVGVSLRVLAGGSRLELTNLTGEDVVVQGYELEPYLLIRRDAVFENSWSPAATLNTSPGRGVASTATDPNARPQWRRIADGPTAVWHDHRTHWMLPYDPPAVASDPGREHMVIDRWEVPILVGGRATAAVGDVRWVPGPDGWAWVALALVVCMATVALALTRRARLVLGVCSILLAAGIVATFGLEADAGSRSVSIAVVPAVLVAFLLGGADGVRRHTTWALPLLTGLGTGALLFLGDHAGRLLTSSQLPNVTDPNLQRGVAAGALGLSLGLVLGSLVAQRHALRYLLPQPPAASPRHGARVTAASTVEVER